MELTANQTVYFRVRGWNWTREGEFTFKVESTTHIHNYTYSYTYNGVHNHIAYCACGLSITEIHNYVQSGVGHRCTKCLHYTTGPVIVAPYLNNKSDYELIND